MAGQCILSIPGTDPSRCICRIASGIWCGGAWLELPCLEDPVLCHAVLGLDAHDAVQATARLEKLVAPDTSSRSEEGDQSSPVHRTETFI